MAINKFEVPQHPPTTSWMWTRIDVCMWPV
jgi:hypothetical protein